MYRCCRSFGLGLCGLLLAGGLPGAADVGQAQEVALASKGPRFLVAATPTSAPVPIDARSAPVLRQRIALDLDGVPLADALTTLGQKAGLEFVYSRDVIAPDSRVYLQAKQITVAAALTELLLDSGVDVLLSPDHQVALVKRARGGRVVGTIAGRVTDAKTGGGVVGAEVLLDGTRWQVTTDTGGRYRLAEVDTGSYTLTVRRLGYARQSRAITVVAAQDATVDVALEPIATRLDELVTTVTGPQRRLEIANAVTVLKADSIVRTQPIHDVTDLLETRVPGLAVLPSTGAPGDPSRLRLRGPNSILRSNDPIVIVDGVRIREGYGASLANSDVLAPSALDRIDPNSIETIEVMNGPSATAQYGADAANGVIIITTKRGRPGPAQWDASLGYGRSEVPGRFPDAYFGFWRALNEDSPNCSPASVDPTCTLDSIVAYQVLNDPDLTVLGQGHRREASLTVSGGQSTITYAVTGSYSDERGLLKLPEYEANRFRETFGRPPEDWMERPHHLTKWSLTSNFTFRPAPSADITLTTSLAEDEQRRANLEQQLGALRGAYVDKVNGLVYLDGITGGRPPGPSLVPDFYRQTVNRALALRTGINFNWRAFRRFRLAANAGVSADLRRDESLVPPGVRVGDIFDSRGAIVRNPDSLGFVVAGQGTARDATLHIGASYDAIPVAWGFQLSAAAGLNFQSQLRALQQERQGDELTSYGWYVAPRLGNQRIFLDLGFRIDGGSNYGAAASGGLSNPFNGLQLPKLGFAWLISDEPWFPLRDPRLLSMLRVRAAYGQAGVPPGVTELRRLYTRVDREVDGQTTLTAPLQTLGNTQLRPERSAEIDWGFEADLLDGRLSAELRTYRKTTKDALLHVPVPPSVGGPAHGSVLINIGVVRNTGFEFTLNTNLLRRELVNWSTQLHASHNRNVVVSLADGLGAFGLSGISDISSCENDGGQCIVVGYPLFSYWARPILGFADVNADRRLQPAEVLLSDSAAYLGVPEPAYVVGLHSTVGLFRGVVAVSASFDYQDGLTQRNGAPGGVLARARVDPSAPLADQALVVKSRTYGLFQTVSAFRFNSLSIGLQLPPAVLRRVGARRGSVHVQGKNLGLVTSYRGKDPLVGGGPGNSVSDGGALPRPRDWQVKVSVTY